MSDVSVFSPQLPGAPDLSCPPPGWSGGVKYRGRGGPEQPGHPTRVIRRTDLRAKISGAGAGGGGGGGGGGQKHNNKPPRFSQLGRRSSWGEELTPEKPTVVEGGEMTEGREESDSGGEGEWKQVKGRRWNNGKEENRKSPRTTPEPPPLNGKSQRNRKSPPGLVRKSPDFGKSPPGLARKSPPGLVRKSPDDRRSPPGFVKGSPESTKPSVKASGVNEKSGKPPSRRGSSSSYDGEFPSLAVKSKVSVSPPPSQPGGKQKDLMKEISPMFVTDLPDEQSVRDYQKRRISDIKSQKKTEESFPLQREILQFLRRSWQETCRELDESSHIWPPKIVYYV